MIPFANRARSARNGAQGYLRLKTTVDLLGAWMFLMATSRYPQPLSCARASSIENFTSAAVIGWPFEKRTPLRSLRVYFFPPCETLYEVASHGSSVFPSRPTVYRDSLICCVSQIDSFWKTFVLSNDCESSWRAILRVPPRFCWAAWVSSERADAPSVPNMKAVTPATAKIATARRVR